MGTPWSHAARLREVLLCIMLASFPGLVHLLVVMHKKPGPFYHVVHAAGIFLHHTQHIYNSIASIVVLHR